MRLIYIFDAYCIWSYAFSGIFREVFEKYKDDIDIDALSGGMIMPTQPVPLSLLAPAFLEVNENVKATLGKDILGPDFIWHLDNPDKSDWFPNSEIPARALLAFKELDYEHTGAFVQDIQYSLFYEGRDLTDDQAYLHLLEKYGLEPDLFYALMYDPKTTEGIQNEFELTKKLQANAFPMLFLQVSLDKFYVIAQGYEPFDTVDSRIKDVLAEINN